MGADPVADSQVSVEIKFGRSLKMAEFFDSDLPGVEIGGDIVDSGGYFERG